jgi:hypothetical protein
MLKAGRAFVLYRVSMSPWDDLAEEEHLTRIRMIDDMQRGEYPTLRT